MVYRRIYVALGAFFLWCTFVGSCWAQFSKASLLSLKEGLGKKSNFSLIVLDAQTGRTLVDYRSTAAMVPASITKVMTTGAAYLNLGKGFRYETPVYLEGVQEGSIFHGNLILQGSGDPSIDSHYFPEIAQALPNQLIEALNNKGIKKLEGQLLIDASLFSDDGYVPSWEQDDIGNYYATGCYSVSLFDNYYDVYASVAKNRVALIGAEKYPWVQFINELRVGKRGTYESDKVSERKFIDRIRLYGKIPVAKEVSLKPGVPNPADYMARYLEAKLSEGGITITHGARGQYHPISRSSKSQELFRYKSPELKEVIKITNVVSHNLFAESLARTLEARGKAVLHFQRPYAVMKVWKTLLGQEATGIDLYDGSGLSRLNRLTARAVARAIHYLYKQDGMGGFASTLPIAKDRSIEKNTIRNLQTRDSYIARLKSGSMKGVKSYAGILEKAGRAYVVVFIANGAASAKATEQFVAYLNRCLK